MVLGLLTLAIASIPTTIGVAEGVSYQRQQNAAAKSNTQDDERRMKKFHLEVYCEDEDEDEGDGGKKGNGKRERRREVHGRRVGLRDGKLYVETPSHPSSTSTAHPVTAFYVPYPDPSRPPTLGLVSTIPSDPPTLNWIYVDKCTYELKYGNRTASREHFVGPWDWTAEDEGEVDGEGEKGKEMGGEGLVFDGWEGFVLVREGEGVWGVRFDRGDDGLKGVEGVRGKRVLRVSLERKMVEGGE